MSTNWKAGDKAVCVDGRPSAWGDNPAHPTLNTIYLVREVIDAFTPAMVLGKALRVGLPGEDAGGWCATRFRKIVTATERASLENKIELPHENPHR